MSYIRTGGGPDSTHRREFPDFWYRGCWVEWLRMPLPSPKSKDVCLTQNCCLRYTVGIRCHFFPTHLLPVTLTLREANGTFLQETQASGLNPERAGENLKALECIFTLQAKQTVCGVRDKARRSSKQGMNQNKVGNTHFHPLCYNKALASFSTQGSTWTLETV